MKTKVSGRTAAGLDEAEYSLGRKRPATASGVAGWFLGGVFGRRKAFSAQACGVSATTLLCLLFFFASVLPLGVAMHLAHERRLDDLTAFLALAVVAGIVLAWPIAHLVGHYVILRSVKEINKFCLAIKQGNYAAEFALPEERDEEHDLIRLKRNLNWMARSIASREDWLHARLQQTAESKRRFEDLSLRDPLTDIANRRAFSERLGEMARMARATRTPFHLLLVDCDNFKGVNDAFGHLAGDDLLRRLAGILRTSVRDGDCPFRYGGDEFGALVASRGADEAKAVAERIRQRFAGERIGRATLSIGMAAFNPEAVDLAAECEALVARADAAVYAAKRAGGDRIVVQADEIMVASA